MDILTMSYQIAATAVAEEVIEGDAKDVNMDGVMAEDGTFVDPAMETGMVEVKAPLLSSWPFVIGVSAAVLFVSIVLGALLARRKIKKGIELYED